MKTIKRKRVNKTRYELTSGECFWGLHFWKYSLYIGKPVKRLNKGSRLHSIKDAQGLETITSTGGAS